MAVFFLQIYGLFSAKPENSGEANLWLKMLAVHEIYGYTVRLSWEMVTDGDILNLKTAAVVAFIAKQSLKSHVTHL